MAKWFLRFLFFYVFLTIAVAVAAYFFLPSLLKNQIEMKVREVAQAQFQISQLRIRWGFPLGLDLRGIEFESKLKGEKVQIEGLFLKVGLAQGISSWKNPHPVLQLQLNKIIGHVRIRPPPKEAEKNQPQRAMELPSGLADVAQDFSLKDLTFDLRIQDLNLKIEKMNEDLSSNIYEIKKGSFSINLPNLKSAGTLSTDFLVEGLPYLEKQSLPFKFSTQVLWSQKWIQVHQANLNFLGIELKGSGRTTTQFQNHEWTAQAKVDDLQKIPLQGLNLPLKSWSGSLLTQLKMTKAQSTLPWNGEAEFYLKNLKAGIQFESENLNLVGQVGVNLSTRAQVQGDQFFVKKAEWSVDLTDAELSKQNLFKKPKGIVLTSSGTGSWDKSFVLQSALVQLDKINLGARGVLSLEYESALHVKVSPTEVSGLEKMILPLSQFPLRGQVAGDFQFNGKIKSPREMKIQVNDLKINQLQGSFAWKKPDGSIDVQGPFLLNLNAQGKLENLFPVGLIAQGFADVTSMKIKYADLYSKLPGQKFQLKFQTLQKPNGVELNNTQLATSFGRFDIQGMLPFKLTDPLDLKLNLREISFQEAARSVPMISKYVKAGTLSGEIHTKGKVLVADILQSPLQTQVKLNIQLPELNWASKVPPDKSAVKAPTPKYEPSAFIKKTPVFEALSLELQTQILKIQYNDLPIEKLNSRLKIYRGNLTGNASIQKIFSGGLNVSQLLVPLFEIEPVIQVSAEAKSIELAQALGWALPSFKDLVAGRGNASVQVKTVLPSHPKFLSLLDAQGSVSIPQGKMQTLKFVSMAKEGLSKIPGIGQKVPQDLGPLEAAISAQFHLKNSKLELKNFDSLTTQQDQVKVSGNLGLDKNVDLEGAISLRDAPVSGSFREANSDAQGRLVTPVMIKGNILEPKMSFAEKTIQTMIQKTLDLESQKLKSKVQAEANKLAEQKKQELQNEVEKQKKKIEQSAQNELNKILGR